AQRVDRVTPKLGSTNGATRLTIEGQGFAQQSQFSLNTNDPNFGNAVTLVSRTRSFPCDVERDASLSTKITCYTRPMPEDDYEVHVTVDGIPIPASSICWGNRWNYWCMLYTRWYSTPTIQTITPLSGLPGSLVTLRGRIFTDVYGSNTATSSNSRNVRFLRAYMGGMPCVLLKPNSDELYGLSLDSVYSDWGYMSCKMTGSYVGHHNLSYILDSEFGRSLPDFQLYSVSALNKIAMFQTYAEVTGVSPSGGSMLGGTLLTITGHYFDETDAPAEVLVGGRRCEVQSVTDETITCRTPEYAWSNTTVFPGGRGFKMEMWNNTSVQHLEDVLTYNSSRPGYSVQWVDSLSYAWPNEIDYFVARFSGFFVPTETDNYYFLIKGDDRTQLYFSITGRPQDKLEHPHTVPADGAVGLEVEGHQVFWTCDNRPFILVLTRCLHTRIRWASPPRLKRDSSLKMTLCHSESLHDSLSCVVQPSADGAALTGRLMEDTTARWRSVMVVLGQSEPIYVLQVKIAYQNYWATSYYTSPTQRSNVMQLEKGKAYYIEVLVQEYTVVASVDVGFFKERSSFTAQQTIEAVNEKQVITASYDVLAEKQVLRFEGWSSAVPVKEVQTVTISSDCFSMGTCDYTYYALGYGAQRTGSVCPVSQIKRVIFLYCANLSGVILFPATELIPVSAPAQDVQAKLNALWTIKPDTVTVTKPDLADQSQYNITFSSNRGDFKDLYYWTSDPGVNITVSEVRKGRADLNTFTLLWGGVPSSPLPYNASETQVLAALGEMVSAVCPPELLSVENSQVKYSRDYESSITGLMRRFEKRWRRDSNVWHPQFAGDLTTRGTMVNSSEPFCGQWSLMNPTVLFRSDDVTLSGATYGPVPLQLYGTLCLAYKGFLQKGLEVVFTYQGSSGSSMTVTTVISPVFDSGNVWKYKCVDLLAGLQASFPGSNYRLLELHLYRDTGDYYIDAVQLLRTDAMPDVNSVIQRRRPPALADSGKFFHRISVQKLRNTSYVSYEITASPYNCASDFPLIEIGFLQRRDSFTRDSLVLAQDNATVSVTRTQRASPPLSGTFSAEIFGQRVEGLAVDISADDLRYALQGIPELGQLSVARTGNCKGYNWSVEWLTMPGSQPLLQINDSTVAGVNPSVTAQFREKGGLFKQRIMGDFLRVLTDKTQVQVLINGIPSKCSGDCGFTWSEAKTPTVTGISPSEGASALGTVLTISGSGFNDGSAVVQIGNVSCSVLQVTSTSLTCTVGPASAGLYPVSVSFPALGYARYSGGKPFNFTQQMGVSSIEPTAGSITGGTVITISGYGFGFDTVVTVGNASCDVISVDSSQLRCRVPAGSPGAEAVTLKSGGIEVTANDSFTYDNALMAIITGVTPQTTTVFGFRTLTIQGQNFENRTNDCSVLVGSADCAVLNWTDENITCLLPSLPPGVYNVSVSVGNRGYPEISAGLNPTIEYTLEVSSISPQQGSLYGGTTVTIIGFGFSPDLPNNTVTLGGTRCEVIAASDRQLQCVTQTDEQTYVITNQGIAPNYGQGYAWSPSTVTVSVGDTVVWRWNAPDFVTGLGYRVFSVASPSSTEFDGVVFNSGNTKTASGFFSYRFTSPGVYYYSSGYVDAANQRSLQGVVNVRPLVEGSSGVQVTVAGFQALQRPGSARARRSASVCVASPECSNTTSDSLSFSFSTCASPTVDSISPTQGTVHDPIVLQGSGFSNISCANEVRVGNASCNVINSTSTVITCLLSSDSGAPVGIPLPVQVRVNNLGAAMLTMPSELSRRVVILPVVDSISPSVGSTSGRTRLIVSGSGLTSGVVTVAGVPCTVVSSNYTQVLCDTFPSLPRTGTVSVSAGVVSSSCSADCSYEYSAALAPQVSSVYPTSVSGNQTAVVIAGSGFGSSPENLAVLADSMALEITNVTDSNITLSVGPLPAGPHPLQVVVRNKGLATGTATLTSVPLASLQPTAGSLAGGTLLMVTGNGFVAGNTSVMLGSYPCSILQVTPSTVQCLTHSYSESVVLVNIQVAGVKYPQLSFNYSREQTPKITSISPTTGPSGTLITVSGSGFGSDAGLVSVNIDGVLCSVSSITDTAVQCTVGEHAGGTFPVVLSHQVKGRAQGQTNFTYELRLTQVSPNEGSYAGGAMVAVQGTGFDPNSSKVLICSKECNVSRNLSSSTTLYCEVPPYNGTQAEQACTLTVLNSYGAANLTNGYTYKSSLTPVIADVSPRRGGTAGGTVLTITGSGFSGGNITVTIAGSVCDVQSVNETQVICVTNAQPRSQLTKVRVKVGDRGIAKTDRADFFYIDVWSSRYTWGGESPPEKGTFAVITKGQTILLDVSTPVLKMLLIQGGKLIFDEADIELQAENILITDGGALQIGTEDAPFQHKAIITLHGHLRSPEIPVYGAKTLGIREGVLDLHGIPIPIPWTRLAQTANRSSTTLTLMDSVTWRVGDEIVIASTGHRHSQIENEVRVIAAVSADGRTLTLTQPLNYTHLGVSVTLPDGTVFEARAEVGVLTRNIVVRGSVNNEWSDQIQACPDGFNTGRVSTGEFATQTCFQGRFGEEVGSDQFGGCIMFHAPRPNENLAIGRIEYVEIFNAGQAFRLGRYPIHWHLMGDIKFQSYVRGCAIHQTYNRAVTIHNTHRLLVERNVIYNIMGGAFFIEDGIETGNVLQYNLAVFVKQSTSLLNDDVTPAGYWVTNPNNTIRHNAAAGGTHFGFWYRMHDHPDGPSYDANICQKLVPLGEFYNNTVHSQGWFGLWIFQEYFPVQKGTCGSTTPQPAVFRRLTSWNNEKGAEWVNVGSVQFSEFLMVNNEKAGVETKRIIQQYVSGWGLTGGAALVNSTMVGHVDELGLGSNYCTVRGVILPLDDGMSVLNTKFINFDRPSCAGIGVAAIDGTCKIFCGGWSAKFSGIQYYQTPNKAAFRWEHEVVLIDTDGSLTGNPGYKVLPKSNLLDSAHCSDNASWSVSFPGSVCDSTMSFHRLAFNNPSPSSLLSKDVILTNTYGTSVVPFVEKLITHGFGWMALIPSDQTYNWYFRGASQISNISYSAIFYGFKPQDYVIVNHNLTQSPDRFYIVDNRNGSSVPLNANVNGNGDWYFNKSSNNLFYMVSGRASAASRRRRSVDRSSADISVAFSVYNCFYPNCVQPTPAPPATLPPTPTRRPANFMYVTKHSADTVSQFLVVEWGVGVSSWSNQSFWKSSPGNNFTVPKEGANVVIPAGMWVVLDTAIPPLNKLTVMGVLEIPDSVNSTSSRVARSLPEYSSIVLNATYISIQGGRLIAGWADQPFRGDLRIILRGNHYTPEWPLSEGVNQGSKVLGVFGSLDLYGLPHNVYRTKLASTAQAGSNSITLLEPVDWQFQHARSSLSLSSHRPCCVEQFSDLSTFFNQAGDEIVLSTTSYDPGQTETRTITAVMNNGLTLTLDQPLTFTHIGENYTVAGTSQSYRLAGDVGLLSRNIKIIGQDYPNLFTESFGGRVLVGAFSRGGIDYRGKAQIRDVEFYHTGQEGWTDYTDPRYSLAFLNLGAVTQNESYIKGCAFHHGFAPAIGIFGTDGLSVDDNVIHHTVGEGIRVWGNNNVVRRNLVTMTLWPGSYNGRAEAFNFNWNAAIEANEGTNVLLQGNIVAGYERVAFRIDGEPCPGYSGAVARWQQNEAHGGLFGVYMNKDGLPGCSQIQGFTIWRSFDFGIYFQVPMSVIVSNVTLVDNGLGIASLIYEPASVSHVYSNKTVLVQNALIVGSSPNFNCSDSMPMDDNNMVLSASGRAPRPLNGGRSGIAWPTFESAQNGAPVKAHNGLMSYNAITGLLTVTDTTFVGFRNVCSSQTNYMFMTSTGNEDLQHPVHVRRITKRDSTEGAQVFIHRPDLSKVNPSDCVDMDCDAKKKTMLTDLDGSFLGAVGSVVPQSEYEWNGDPRHGLGDYRIPKVMLTYLNGSRIPVNQIAPNKEHNQPQSAEHNQPQSGEHCVEHNQPQSGEHNQPQSGEQSVEHNQPQSGEHNQPQSGEQSVEHNQPQSGEQSVEHNQPQSGEHNQPQSGEHNQPQSGEQSVEHNQPQSGEQSVEHNQPQSAEQSVEHNQPQSGEQSVEHNQPQSGAHNQPQSGEHNQPQSGEHNQPQSGAHNQPQSGEQSVEHNQPQSGEPNQPQSGEPNQPQSGEPNQPQSGEPNQPQSGEHINRTACIIRDSSCTYMNSWQAYKCFGLNYRMLVIESLDSDTETRRLSPVAVLGDGYVDLVNGPQDHGWCAGYTCQKRVSLFHSIIATNKSFDIYFTSTSPQKLRLMMLNANPTETVRVAIFYSKPQRLDVYANNLLVAPTNAQWNSGKTDYTLLEPAYPGQYVPSLNSTLGSNFFDPDYKMLHVLLRGSDPVEIKTSPVLFIAFNLPAMSEAEFFGDKLVTNLALFLKVPPNMIRITKIVREGSARRRRATGLTVEVEIKQPPVTQTSTNSTSDQQFEVLKDIADNLGQAAVSGNLSQSIGFNVSSMGIVPPSPPPSDPSWSQVANQTVTREDPPVQTVKSVSSLIVVVEPVAGLQPGPLSVQPSIMAVDQAGDCVSVGVTTLTITAVLKDNTGNLVNGLSGNTTIPFSTCWANYTDLAIPVPGENLTLAFTLNDWTTQSRSFNVKAISPTLGPTDTTKSPVRSTTDSDYPSIFDSSPHYTVGTVYMLILLSALHLLYRAA
ncbi:hypothetical protein NFI96_027165, partial [Prochilodus magdalenae]